MTRVCVIGSDATFMPLEMPDDNAISHWVEVILLTEIGAQFSGFHVHGVKISRVG